MHQHANIVSFWRVKLSQKHDGKLLCMWRGFGIKTGSKYNSFINR